MRVREVPSGSGASAAGFPLYPVFIKHGVHLGSISRFEVIRHLEQCSQSHSRPAVSIHRRFDRGKTGPPRILELDADRCDAIHGRL